MERKGTRKAGAIPLPPRTQDTGKRIKSVEKYEEGRIWDCVRALKAEARPRKTSKT